MRARAHMRGQTGRTSFARVMAAGLFGLSLLMSAQMSRAQDFGLQLGQVVSPVFVVDESEVFRGTKYGARLIDDYRATITRLTEESEKIASALEEEERGLAARRAEMEREAFLELAEEFNTRANEIRQERLDAAENAKAQFYAAQQGFAENVQPILFQLLRQRGGVVLLDRRSVIYGLEQIDLTQDAIAEVDRTLGEGPRIDAPLDMTAPGPSETKEEDALLPVPTLEAEDNAAAGANQPQKAIAPE